MATQLGVVACLDRKRIVEALPKFLDESVIGSARRNIDNVIRNEAPIVTVVYASNMVVLVVNDERLNVEPRSKVVHDERHNVRIRATAGKPDTVLEMRETHELARLLFLVGNTAFERQ